MRTLEALRAGGSSAGSRTGTGEKPGYEAWHRLLEVMVCLRAEDPQSVLRWRTEAEEVARARGRPALEPGAIEDYVRRFRPAYEHYAPTVASGRWSPDRQLALTLDAERVPR